MNEYESINEQTIKYLNQMITLWANDHDHIKEI
jgi:hypothetical protein